MSDAKATETSARPRLAALAPVFAFLKPYRWAAFGALIALVVAAGAVLGIGQAVRRVIDFGFGAESSDFLDLYFGALFGVVMVLAVATFARFYLVSWLGERVVADIRKAVYGHILSLSPAWFETAKVGAVLSRLTTDTELIQTLVGSSLSVALRNFLLFLGSAVLLVITSLHLAGLVALLVPVVVLPIVVFGRKVRALSRATQDEIAAMSAQAGESLNAIATVQAYTREDREQARFSATTDGAFNVAARRIRARAWLTALVMLLVFGGVDAVMWFGGKAVFAGTMSAGQLSAFVFYAVVCAASVGALSEVWGDVQRAAGAAERIMELLATQSLIQAPQQPKVLPKDGRGAVAIENVTFHYPARPETPALAEFSLEVKPGETVALVGPSGAGKTTVFQLLLRFYDPEKGAVRIDGVNVAEADPRAVRARIGLVSQDPVIFAASAADNIRYGRPDATMADVEAAAEVAAAAGFIRAMPQGFDTFLGERGMRLSGGQRQRIAIARAVLRDPALLLLDEATSALDAESERKVQAAMEHLLKGRTSIVIAHRLATVLKANRIVVMEKGRIIATGTHAELIAQGGLYARLAQLQFGEGAEALRAAGA